MIPAAIHDAPSLPPHPIERSKFAREQRAFLGMLPDLLKEHRGKFVAVHHEQVVALGDELMEVTESAYARHGNVPMCITRIIERPLTPERVPLST